jgi:hypothetical protein
VPPVPRRLSLAAALLSLSALALLGCSGVVPKPQLSVSPNPVAVGQTVTLDGSASSNLLADPAISFDLDGDGETDRKGTLVAQTSYSQPGKVTVSLIISQGSTFFVETRGVTQTITVTDPHLPTPDFTISPNPACQDVPIRFDASGSSDPDGSIADYKWDLNGDGTFETDTGTNPIATSPGYPAHPNQRRIKLRVTDNDGHATETARGFLIWDVGCGASSAASVSTAAVEHKARFALTVKAQTPTRGTRLVTGGHLITSGSRTGGSVRLRGLPTPLQHLRRARWLGSLTSDLNLRTQRLKIQGQALLRLGRKGNLCTSLVITGAKGRHPRGTMKVLGGSGAARHIDGQAAYTGRAAGLTGPLKVAGHIEMEQKANGRGLTRACKALLPKRGR